MSANYSQNEPTGWLGPVAAVLSGNARELRVRWLSLQ